MHSQQGAKSGATAKWLKLCSTIGLIFSLVGPCFWMQILRKTSLNAQASMMEPYAKTAASLNLQYCCMLQ